MKRRQILLDEASDRILRGLAKPFGGDQSRAVREALKVHNAMEGWLDQVESEKGFREGRFTPWEEVKRRLRL